MRTDKTSPVISLISEYGYDFECNKIEINGIMRRIAIMKKAIEIMTHDDFRWVTGMRRNA